MRTPKTGWPNDIHSVEGDKVGENHIFDDWISSMDHDLDAFVRVADKGSFAAAALDLDLSSSAVSKLISRLEDRLGARLLHRTTRRLALTSEGEVFLQRAREIVDAIREAEAEVVQSDKRPHGRLRVNCTSGFAFHQLARVLPDFIDQYPDLRVVLSVTDRVVDLLAENADVGLRSGEVSAPTLVVKRIANFQRRLYASPGYLARRGKPSDPSELVSRHRCVNHGPQDAAVWPFLVDGRRRDTSIPSHLVVDNAETALRLALAGAGIVRVADMMACAYVEAGRLRPVLHQFHFDENVPFSAVYPQGRHRMPKVRVFLDFLSTRFRAPPWNPP